MSWPTEPTDGWNEGIGHNYTRNQGPNPGAPKASSTAPAGARTQWSYIADAYVDVQPNAARFYLTNDPNWHLGSSTWAELLPYKGWSADSVSLTINKGNDKSGTAYIVFVDESLGITTPVVVAQGSLQ